MIVKELFAKLGLFIDDSGFTKGERLLKGLGETGAAVGGMMAAAAFALGEIVRETANAGDEANKAAQKVGITAEQYQALGYAAKLADISQEAMTKGLVVLSRNLYAAKQGNEEAAKSFRDLGVDIGNHNGKAATSLDILERLADRYAKMPDGMEKTALAQKVLSKMGADFIPLLNAGAKGLREMMQEARDFGYVISNEDAAASEVFNDTLTRLQVLLIGLRNTIGVELLPEAQELATRLLDWAKANREIIKTRLEKVIHVLKIGAHAFIVTLVVLAKTIGWVIDNMRLLAIILGAVVLTALVANEGALISLIGWYIAWGVVATRAGLKAAASFVAANAALFGWFILFVGVLLLLEDFYVMLTGGDSLMGELFQRWNNWLTELEKPMPGDSPITQFFKSLLKYLGDIKLAWQDFVAVVTGDFEKISPNGTRILEAILGPRGGPPELQRSLPGPNHSEEPGFADKYVRPFLELFFDKPAWRTAGFAPGADPANAPGWVGGHSGGAPQMSVDISIVQQPGQSAEDLSSHMTDKLDKWYDGKMREAAAGVSVPPP